MDCYYCAKDIESILLFGENVPSLRNLNLLWNYIMVKNGLILVIVRVTLPEFIFNTLFGNDFTRESDNDINAALDYGYTLLLSMFAREVVVCGCMTQIGLKHANQFNQFNLASDIMEPFRPIIDRIVYQNRHNFVKIKELFSIFSNLSL